MPRTDSTSAPFAGGRSVLVTGAASGIGRATVEVFAESGHLVAAVDRDGVALEAFAAGHPQVVPFTADVTESASVRAMADGVSAALGCPDAVVNCAGWDESRPFADTDPEFWAKVVAVNYLGVLQVTHAFVGAMRARGSGRIVNVASDAARVGSSGEAVYAGAKGAVVAFTKSIAREVARAGVTANVVCPGPTDTPLFRRQPEALRAALERAIPMRRLGAPSDVAHAIAFFVSEAAGYVTGQVLSVSGGLTMAG